MAEHTAAAGSLIAFEGLDGAGKSTQIGHLADALSADGYRVDVRKLNANRLFKDQCRRLNDCDLLGPVEAALTKAAELAGRFEFIATSLEQGVIVVWDKYIVGSIASDIARNVPPIYADALLPSLPEPDVTVYLEIAPAEALRRKRELGGPRVMESGLDVTFGARQAHAKIAAGEIDQDTMARHFLAFQTRMSEAYARYLPPGRTLRLDAGRSQAELAESIAKHVRRLLSERQCDDRVCLAEAKAVVHNTSLSRQSPQDRSV
jgi:dTMP kinase